MRLSTAKQEPQISSGRLIFLSRDVKRALKVSAPFLVRLCVILLDCSKFIELAGERSKEPVRTRSGGRPQNTFAIRRERRFGALMTIVYYAPNRQASFLQSVFPSA